MSDNLTSARFMPWFRGCFAFLFPTGTDKGQTMRQKAKHVQLYIPEHVSTDSTQLFSKLLVTKLEKDLKKSIICRTVDKDSLQKGQKGLPLLLVCPLSSRAETCIDYALEGFQWKAENKFAVILLHFETKMSLPEISSSKYFPTLKPAYKNARFIEVAFNKDDKLYECDMNKAAFKEMEDFVDSNSDQQYIG